jgi:hypothetical protein
MVKDQGFLEDGFRLVMKGGCHLIVKYYVKSLIHITEKCPEL